MSHRKLLLNKLAGFSLVTAAILGAPSAHASVITDGSVFTPAVTSGALPDSPGAHVDPNGPASAFSGVVSLNVRFAGQSLICSGALVGKRTVISAGHCVDVDGNGTTININAPGNDVRVVFNSLNAGYALRTAVKVAVNPDYDGFGHCPVGVNAFCVNDDVAVITLGADAPASAKIYKIAANGLTSGSHITMAGYGTTGDGVNGYIAGSADFFVKRTGENYADLIDGDDEAGFGGRDEVFYADFDGGGKDSYCTRYGVCTPQLANDRESGIGGGDSGGPSFVNMYGEMMLVANNTFSGARRDEVPGTFGTTFGGMILGSYASFLQEAAGNDITFVPEPGSFALFGLGALALVGARRRRASKAAK
jgi:hypothetical protein